MQMLGNTNKHTPAQRMLENGERQYLAHYDDPNLAPAFVPEGALPRELTDPLNPPQGIISAMPAGEGSIEFDWVRQELIGKFKDKEKIFLKSRWRDKEEGAIKAARNWLLALRG